MYNNDKQACFSARVLENPEEAREVAPEIFKVRFKTTKGEFTMEAHRIWSPRGTDRFFNLVKMGYFTNICLHRVVSGFVVQFGIHGNPKISNKWKEAYIEDDPVKQSNLRGYVTFASGGSNMRTTQLFINYGDNSKLDSSYKKFSPICKVIKGMDIVDSFYSGYENKISKESEKIYQLGNDWLQKNFPELDYIISANLEN